MQSLNDLPQKWVIRKRYVDNYGKPIPWTWYYLCPYWGTWFMTSSFIQAINHVDIDIAYHNYPGRNNG